MNEPKRKYRLLPLSEKPIDDQSKIAQNGGVIKVTFHMCDKDSGGFSTGIGRYSWFTLEELNAYKHYELIEGIPLIEGCEWSYSFGQWESKPNRADRFKMELKQFLQEWGAEIELEDVGRGYVSDYIIVAHLSDFTEIRLGTSITPD